MKKISGIIAYLQSWATDSDIKKNELAKTVINRASFDLKEVNAEIKQTIIFLIAMVSIETLALATIGIILA